MGRNTPPDVLVKKLIQLIDLSLRNLDYVNAIYWILGISGDDTPAQTTLFNKLLQDREHYQNLHEQIMAAKKMGKSVRTLNIEEHINAYQEVLRQTQNNKTLWQSGPVKILCSDDKLLDIALRVRERGFVTLSKGELEEFLDFSAAVDFWDRIPNYTVYRLGGGIAVSSPELDLFESMCWFYDEALRTHRELLEYREQLESPQVDASVYHMKSREHFIMCRQTLVSAFLLVEAFINSVAHASLSDPNANFTEDQRLYLSEKTKDKNGHERQKFVPIENKLYEWVKIIGPTGKTFNKGSNPFQEFKRIKQYRDAIVHMSASKVEHFRSIDFDVASKAAHTALEMIKKISKFTAPEPHNVEYPFWLREPDDDGMFHFSTKIELQLKSTV